MGIPKEDDPAKVHYLCPKRHSIQPARKRGIFFEFRYGNIVGNVNFDETLPKLLNCISLLVSNTSYCQKSNSVHPNIVFSSHLQRKTESRSPSDLQHFCSLFD